MALEWGPIRPLRIKKGDLVGVVAPAGGVDTPDSIFRGREVLENLGFRVALSKGSLGKMGYLSGSVSRRCKDLMEFFADPEVRAIICLRGGYGSMHLISLLDYRVIRNNPKIFVGYSDITALHLAISRHTGLVTFHGPMLASDWGQGPTSYTVDQFLRGVMDPAPLGLVTRYAGQPPMLTICPGRGCGRLTGGNLTLICSTLGTPFEIDTQDSILFLEEIGEAPYRIDRMLTQLRLAGKLLGVRGIVFGECVGCGSEREETRVAELNIAEPSLEEVLRKCLGGLDIPCVYGLAAGHGRNKVTLPLGAEAMLDANTGQLSILGQAVY